MLEYWYKALHQPLGFRFSVSDRELFRQKLYQAREQSGDPDLDKLGIVLPPGRPTEVWIVHKEIQQETTDAPSEE